MYRSLLLGGGRDWRKRVYTKESGPEWNGDLTVIDMNPDAKCAYGTQGKLVVANLEEWWRRGDFHPDDNSVDEIGAYDVLEHVGKQGDWMGWFAEMAEYHRILKPGGFFGISVPIGEDALADPGHTRFFQVNWFGFLSRRFYESNTKERTLATDYRWYLKKYHPELNFDIIDINQSSGHHLAVVMRAVK